MMEKTNVPLDGALILNAPAASVEVPVLVPSTITVAPTTGLSVPSVTRPETSMVWARADVESKVIKAVKRRQIFFISIYFCLTYIGIFIAYYHF